jgi:hypothetical protein
MHLMSELSAVIVQPSAEPGEVALFRLTPQGLAGPEGFSTLGMRLHNEQSGASSLFSHPVALAPVPLEPTTADIPADTLEDRLERALAALRALDPKRPANQQVEDHLALFTRWSYRPAAKRTGEAVFADPAGSLSTKLLLRAISRVARSAAAPVAVPAG